MADTPMKRVPREELPEVFRPAWDALDELTGEPAFVEVFAQAPDMLGFVMGHFYQDVFFGGNVDNRFKQLIRLKLSLTHGCHTCNLQNVPGSLQAGITQPQVDAMDDFENGPFDDRDKAVLRLAEQMALTNHDGKLTPQLYAQLQTFFSDQQICEMCIVAGVIGGLAKMAFVMGLVEKEDYCPFAGGAAA